MIKKNTRMLELGSEVAGGASGSKTAESFDYTAIQGYRATIAAEVENAVKALNGGTDIIETAFGATGGAMTGGSSNAIKNKWEELALTIKNFAAYLDTTIANIKTVGVSNEALEAQAKALFATTDNFGGGAGSPGTANSNPTAATYERM